MEYFLTEQQSMVRSLARRIAEERVLPAGDETMAMVRNALEGAIS